MDELVAVANFRSSWEAEAAAKLLEDQDIGVVIQSGEGARLGPMPSGTTILVAPENEEAARRALADIGVAEGEAD